MHIMLFGGAFDPPHNGHLQVARAVVGRAIANEVWFIPCAQHPFGKQMSPAADRVAMLQLAGPIKLDLHEVEQQTTNFSIDTLDHFSHMYPDNQFSWLIGSDQLSSFTKWHRWPDLLDHYSVYVYPRQDYPLEPLLPGMLPLTGVSPVAISSTEVRALMAKGQPIDPFVPPAVAHYITQHNLYAS